jgi:serine/threonine-protein kinase
MTVPEDPPAATVAANGEGPAHTTRQVIGERYEILGLLGSGGMGSVYKARDLELDELVALKVLRPGLASAPGMLDRFRREVKLARRVAHPNVARVFDIGEGSGEKILTMELIEGEPLSSLLARARRLSVEQIVTLGAAICAGLGAAHEAGVVHRDLKPDNVLVEKGGRVVITDFGIARAADGDALATGTLVGTPAYMAPEQIESGVPIDARADIYALGALLYELCTGQPPFQAETVFAVAAARLLKPPPDPRALRPELPDGLARLVLRCMARRPEDRFPSAAAVSQELQALTLPQPAAIPASLPPPNGLDPGAAGAKRIAVLPFRNAGPLDQEYLADGLTEEVIELLSTAPGLRVTARGAIMRYKGVERDPRELGRELSVQVVADGTVKRTESGVRITARLASVDDGVQLWARRFDRAGNELLRVSDDAARAVAEALAVELSPGRRTPPADAEAMDLFLRARAAYRRYFTDLEGESSAPLFERALARAPDDPRILAGFAMANTRGMAHEPARLEKAAAAAARAVELAPSLPQAHLAVATVRQRSLEEASSVRSLRRALALQPAFGEAHDLLGRILAETSLLKEARQHLLTALPLEPEITLTRIALARTHELLGEHDEADRVAEQVRDSPLLARFVAWRRDTRKAQDLLRSMPGSVPGQASATWRAARLLLEMTTGGAPPYDFYALLIDPARAPLRSRFFLQLTAEAAAFAGDRARAIDAVTRAAALSLFDVAWMDGCPLFADLRRDPAFVAVREQVAARAARVEEAYRARL